MNEIRNCKFSFKCPKDWETLKQTDNMHQRYCAECDQIVHFCYTPDDLMRAIKEDQCVAIANDVKEGAPFYVGRVASNYGDNQ